MDHKEMSKKGGKAKSDAKTKAARKNASKPRGKWATAVLYEMKYDTGVMQGVLLIPGKIPTSNEKFYARIIAEIEKKTGKTVVELLQCDTVSRLI